MSGPEPASDGRGRGGGGSRRRPQVKTGLVQSVEHVTPHMVRIVLAGPGMAAFTAGDHTDHYVKLLFPADGVTYPEPFDLEQIRATMPRSEWPRMRTYTVRRWDADRRELTIDVLQHGDTGLAGPWSVRVRSGDTVRFAGPGGGYAPRPDADWHLIVGDESAVPAIAATLERLEPGARAHVFVEVSDPAEEQKLDTAADATVTWLHRGAARPGELLLAAVAELDLPPGDVHVFAHGEAGAVRQVRRLLFNERGVARQGQSISGYWRLGQDEDGWQAAKREWNAEVDSD